MNEVLTAEGRGNRKGKRMCTVAEGIFKLGRGWEELEERVVGIESSSLEQSTVGLRSQGKERREGSAACKMPTESPMK